MVALGTDTTAVPDDAGDQPEADKPNRDGHPDPAMSDFHLVESADGWTLTINLNVDLLAALAATDASATPAAAVPVTVHLEPNLVPGEPFLAKVVIKRPAESS
jgi:hypothetical protein